MNEVLLQSAMRAQAAGQFAQAARLYQDILRGDPKHFRALYMLGYLHMQGGRLDDAQRLIGEALKIDSRSPDAQFNRGVALQGLKRDEEALTCFDAALKLSPALLPALVNRSIALLALKRFAPALDAADKALARDGANAEAWNCRGNALMELERADEALAAFDKAVALNAKHAEAWSNRGSALNRLQRFDEALASFDTSQALKPGSAAILTNRATAYAGLKRYDEASAAYEKVLTIDPDAPYIAGELAMARFQSCDWRFANADRAKLSEGVNAGKNLVQPQIMQVLSRSAKDQRRCAKLWVRNKFPPAPAPLRRGKPYRHDKIRLAYLSSDFWGHATSFLMAGVFERHDKARFETTAISFSTGKNDAMRVRLQNAFGRFVDASAMSDPDVASMLRKAEIDIAVDLKGFTGNARTGVMALRPAPVQVNYLGFPGTMAAPYIDYIVADSVLIGEGEEGDYSEAVVRLPGSYQPNDDTREIPAAMPTRSEAGLPESGFVFASFNNHYKIVPEMFDVWMRLLRDVPGSVLWQLADNPIAMRNLKREAEARGVAGSRVIFAPRVKADQHLARQRLADLFLDTLPCNAHTTASDALWAGLPVLTCKGSTFAGRVAASVLTAIGLPDLVTHSLADYEALALQLAHEPVRLSALKARLAAQRATEPLFDTGRFTRGLEAAYRHMWERVEAGQPPAGISLAPDPVGSA